MKMLLEGVDAYVFPDSVYCNADDEKRSPFDIVDCPVGSEVCVGRHCIYYRASKNCER